MESKICNFCGERYFNVNKKCKSKWSIQKLCSRVCASKQGGFNWTKKPLTYSIDNGVVNMYWKDYKIIFDESDLSKIIETNWFVSDRGYAIRNRKNGRQDRMHHLIIGKPPIGLVTDHINRNKLDNRKCNLRFVTQKVNMQNRDFGWNKV